MSEEKARQDAAGQPWLDALEARVQGAVERLTALGAQNRRLRERVADLEARLKRAKAEGAGDEEAGVEAKGAEAAGAEPGGDEAAAWRRERDEVRRRVGRLTETLESLLADAGE